jgi:EmrB/QacA subfamily drug resistance transporter
MTRKNRRIVTFAVMMGTALAALDGTVVSTAMPTITGHLGGLALYPWVFSAYLLTSTISVPIYGKLADLYGRKRLFTVGATLFLIGSALCGTSNSMTQLIAYRVIQGIGAGGVLPLTSTIVGDIYSVEERGRVQGLFSGVWGVSSVVGPLIGGLITQYISWRGIFYMNIPFGLLAIALLWLYLHEQIEGHRPRIDYLGTALLTLGISALLLGIQEGGVDFPWNSWPILTLLALAVVFLALFVWQEFRAPEPVLPPPLFRQRVIAVSTLGALLLGALIIVLPSYLPLYIQGVQGGTALIAGIGLAPLSVLWVIGSYLSGVLVLRLGYRVSALTGVTVASLGLACLIPLGWLSLSKVTLAVLILSGTGLAGIGMGTISLTYLIAVQNSVPWNQRGVATASNQFSRTIGGAIGVAALGAVLNGQLNSRLAAAGISLSGIANPAQPGQHLTVNGLLRPETRSALPANLLAQLVGPLGGSLHILFLLMFLIAAIGIAAAIFLPGGAVVSKPGSASSETTTKAEAPAHVISAD